MNFNFFDVLDLLKSVFVFLGRCGKLLFKYGRLFFKGAINTFKGTVTCPDCNTQYRKEQIPYVCPNCGKVIHPKWYEVLLIKFEKLLIQCGKLLGKYGMLLLKGAVNTFSRKITCPYCMRQYLKNQIPYVCPNCGKVIHLKWYERKPVKCIQCEDSVMIRKCPDCHEELPQAILDTDNLPFSIVGVTSSGKTNYITVMLEELRKFPQIALRPINNTVGNIQELNKNSIYENKVPVPATPPGTTPPQIWVIQDISDEATIADAKIPLLWTIRKLLKRTNRKVPTHTFTIFDGAGEDYENHLDPQSTICRYLQTSKAVLITLDPLIFEEVRSKVDSDELRASLGDNRASNMESANIVNNLASYIRSASGIETDRPLNIPVAIILTKFDMLINHENFAQDAIIKQPSKAVDENRHINTTEFEQIDKEIRDWLENIDETAFVNAVDANFKKALFFGVSSFGHAPDASNHLENVTPHRVLDPILWLFYKAGFIN